MLPIQQSRVQQHFVLLLVVAAICIEARHLAMPKAAKMLAKPFYLDTKNCGADIPSTKFGNSGDFFPWMAKILTQKTNKKWFGCTATIISRNYLLTAAHCLKNMSKTVAYVGSANVEKAQERKVSKGIPHPKYDDDTLINDIALLKLAKPLKFDYIKTAPICLSGKNSQTVGTIAGWGQQRLPTQCRVSSKNIPRIPTDDIKIMGSGQVKIVPMDTKECDEPTGTDGICAVALNAVADQGDSGGPLMVKRKGGGWQQIGVFSRAACHSPTPKPMIYTRVGDYCDWIKKNTKGEVECVD